MYARELMSTGLLTFPPEAPVEVIARALGERGVSGAPVVDAEGKLLGMVTEGDLIRRLAAGAETHRGWFSRLFASAFMDAARFARAEGRRARDVMTTEIAAVGEDASTEAIALTMEERHIRRAMARNISGATFDLAAGTLSVGVVKRRVP